MQKTDFFRAVSEQNSAGTGEFLRAVWKRLTQRFTTLLLGHPEEAGRRLVFLLAALLASTVALEGLFFGVPKVSETSLHWFYAAALFGVTGVSWKRRIVLRVCAFGLSLSMIAALIAFVGISAPTSLLAAVSLISFWSSLFLPLPASFALWLVAGTGFFIKGGHLTNHTLDTHDIYAFPLVSFFAYMIVPLVIGALLKRDETSRRKSFESSIRNLSKEREQLQEAFAAKTKQLEASQQSLVEAERHQTTGRIASGLAHELNNILTPIQGLAELLIQNPHSAHTERYAQSILHSTQSASMMTQALLTYTRQGQFDPLVLESSQLFSQLILPELSSTIPDQVQLHTDVEPGIHLSVDRRLLLQTMWQLLRNAIDAMPKGGVLMLSLRTHQPKSPNMLETVAWARLTVTDTGQGIPIEHQSRVFDPFFTTKTFGVGSGLGLALVHGAITLHGGKVSLETEPGKGTSIHLDFPIAQGTASRLDDDPTSLYFPTQSAVLLASPCADVRDELEELLAERGFAVDCLSNNDELFAELAPRAKASSAARWIGRSWIIDSTLLPNGPPANLQHLFTAKQGPKILVLLRPNHAGAWRSHAKHPRLHFARPPVSTQSLDSFLKAPLGADSSKIAKQAIPCA